MTETNLPGRTDWETREYRKDHGHRVAAAQAYRYIGRCIETDDSYLLPPDCEAVIALAAASMRDYAAGRVNDVKDVARETNAAIMTGSAA